MVETPAGKPARKHLNVAQKRALKAASMALFSQRYGRKAQKGTEPNDRKTGKGAAHRMRRVSPETMDRLMRDDEE